MEKILIADDSKEITSTLAEYLTKEGYCPILAFNGEEAINKFESEKPDILLLDVMMPFKDGFEVCREIRRTSNVPIIMVTARGEDFEKVMGLDGGADDYIVKPFSPNEVMARVRAILRRIKRNDKKPSVFECDGLIINLDEYTVSIDSQPLSLTKTEFDLLWILASTKNKVFTRDNLLNSLWGVEYAGDGRIIDKHFNRLRIKIDKHGKRQFSLITVRSVGYKLEVQHHV